MEIYLEGELFKYNSRSVYVGRARPRRTFLDQDVPEKGQSTRNRRYMNNVMRENEAKELCQGRCCLFIAIGTFIDITPITQQKPKSRSVVESRSKARQLMIDSSAMCLHLHASYWLHKN